MKLRHKQLIKKLIVALAIARAIIFLMLLRKVPFISEYIFARGISRAYIYVVSNLTSVVSFSVYELFVCAMIIAAVFLFVKWVRLLKKKRNTQFYKSALNTLTVVLTVALLYTATASFSYKRQPLPIPQYEGEALSDQQLEEMIRHYFAEFETVSNQVERDENGMVALPYSYKELNKRLAQEFDRVGSLDGYLMEYTPKVKKIVASEVMNYQGITGLAFTPTGEANINRHTPTNDSILTMAHEIAHIKGVMIENDANMTARYLALTSEDIYFRYAGYMYTVDRLLEIAYFTFDKEKYAELYYLYPEAARAERRAEYEHWNKYDTVIDKVSEFMNDVYLKFSGIDEGTDNYRDTSQKIVVTDPDTGMPTTKITQYSPMQKLFIELYLQNNQ
jgi:hypothetical protein